MPVPTGKASQQDFSRFHKPVWPKSHTLHKKPSSNYPYATREELDNEKAGIDQQHRPLKTSHDGTGRLAGTQGRSDHAHPDDQYSQDGSKKNEPDDIGKTLLNTLEDRATEGKTEWSNEEVEKVKDRLRKAQEIGKTRDEALKELYDDESFCFSIREVKQVVKDWKLEDPLLYGAARYVLPTTEKDIKGQNWPGKAEQEAEKAKEAKEKADEKAKDEKSENDTDDKKQENKDDKKTDDEDAKEPQSETSEKDKDQKASPGDDDKSNDQENGESFDDLSEDEQEWYGKLMKEMDQINGLQNNPGIPSVDFGKHGLNALKQKYKVNDGSDEGKIDDVVEARQEARLTKVRDRAMEVQVDDQFTPDSWIPRSSHLLRLTGKHPMNAEPPMSELFDAGLITPTKLHYIRNHGAVPKLAWETHTLEIFSDPPGLLDPAELSMDEIAKDYKAIEIPVTLACTGARREEVNRVKKSGGFGWSAAAVSTCMWTGALVRDILLARNMVEQPEDERWYLNYEGADEPSEGKYATSIPLSYAMDPVNDVMLAYGINGAPLHPDHGYPLRSLIPSFVGGRCVKWLKKIWISKKPNDSHYHIWDNRVVPSFVTSKQSRLGKAFFHSPSTIINEQCLQSVIVKPAHGQYIPLQGEASGKQGLDRKIKVEGFAYHGGGHPVERVELSVDGGENWRHCFRTLPEKALRHGNKFWTWLFWECEVTVKELANAEQVIVRAFDVFKTSQPEHITWNITGMMNNSWYRVKPELTNEPESDRPAILFHHPVPPGAVEGGWMKPSAVEQAKEEAAKSQTDDEKQFTLEEVQKHNTPDDAWIIIDNKVYDVTSVLSWHPGGAAAITNYAGKATVDTTVDYNAIHDDYANSQRDKLLIGRVSDKGIKALAEDAERSKKVQAKLKKERAGFALKASSYSAATLVQRKEISKDTRVYTFSLPKSEDGSHGKLGLPIGNHIQIAFHLQDGVVTRPYTPIRPVTADEEDGTFDLLIKSYFPGSGTKFPPGGTLSNYVDVMKIGEDLDIRLGPSDITYLGKGKFKINDKEFNFEKINLVAGGSGLTPHWQLIHSILKNSKEDKTAISLVDANSTFGDVLMFDELKKYGESHSEQFKPWFTLSKKPEDQDWPYTIGHLDEKIIKEHFWAPEEDKVGTFLCGPPGLIQHGAMPALKNWGFEEGKNLFGF